MSMNGSSNNRQLAFSQIEDREILRNYLFNYSNKLQHIRSLITYTRLDNLARIITDKKWRLGNPLKMNDQKELSDFPRADWQRIFYACFMADTPESIAMWSLYGRPWADGVSISIDRKAFFDWISQCNTFYRKEGDTYVELNDTTVQVVRVAYTNELTKRPTEPISIICGSSENHNIDNIFSDDSSYDSTVFAGLIKDAAWAYEKEIRIRADYSGYDIPDAIFIDVPDYVIDVMAITCGPMFYGNLEYRLHVLCNRELRLNYSRFVSKLNGMPCTDYLSTGDLFSDCRERAALMRAQGTTADAKNLSLHSLAGRGTAIFKSEGTLSLGINEYFFPIRWRREGDHIYLDETIGRNEYNSNIPAANALSCFDFFPQNSSPVEGKAVLIVNDSLRVAAIRLHAINKDDIWGLEYRIYTGARIRFDYAESYYKTAHEIPYELDTDDPLCGTWWDENSKRCNMSIYKKNNKYYVMINWSSSAVVNTQWTMSGEWDKGKKEIVYDDECCLTQKGYFDSQHIELITEYENGTGRIYLKNNEILWEDAPKTTGARCRFVKY